MGWAKHNYHTDMNSPAPKPIKSPQVPVAASLEAESPTTVAESDAGVASSLAPPGLVDTSKFVEAGAEKSGATSTVDLERFDSSLDGEPGLVRWHFAGRLGRMADGSLQRWLSLAVNLNAQMTCARCDEPADVKVSFKREFLLVGDERRAQMLDDDAEEYDVLVGERRFSLTDLLEDECLMSLPTFVSHDSCQPVQVEQEEAPARNPFAALAKLWTSVK